MRKLLSLSLKKISVLFGGRPWLIAVTLAALMLMFAAVSSVYTAKRRDKVAVACVDECGGELSAALHGTQVGCAYIYGEPQIPDAVAKMAKSGIRELTVLPLHPHSSLLTRTAARDALARVPFGLGIQIDVVMPYGEHPFFVTWWKQLVKQAIYANKMTAPHLLFVAPGGR